MKWTLQLSMNRDSVSMLDRNKLYSLVDLNGKPGALASPASVLGQLTLALIPS